MRRSKRPLRQPRPPLELAEAERQIRAALQEDADRWDVHRFVLEHGVARRPVHRPDDIEPGAPRDSFANALALARSRPGLTYYEGYSLPRGWTDTPNRHAWCVDDDERAIDPTPGWTDPDRPLRDCYFGLAIPLELAQRHPASGVLYEFTGRIDALAAHLPAA